MSQVAVINPEDFRITEMWTEFLRLTEGEEWKFSAKEREELRIIRAVIDDPSWFLEALEV